MNGVQNGLKSEASSISLPMARLRIQFEAQERVRLPAFGGSMLRGCLGHGLRALSCVMSADHPCASCHRRAACRYSQLFEPMVPPDMRQRYSTVPAPWVLEPEWSTPLQLNPGEHFSCRINLFGPAIEQMKDLLCAFDQGVRRGVGKGQGRARMAMVLLEHEGQWIPLPTTGTLEVGPTFQLKSSASSAQALDVQLEILTPARLQARGHVCGPSRWDARLLLASLYRKVKLYDSCYLDDRLPASPPPLGEAFLQGDLRVTPWQRYSSRQGRAIRMNGVTGTLRLRHLPAQWLPWLELGQWTHLGKNTGFGLGCYRLIGTPDNGFRVDKGEQQ